MERIYEDGRISLAGVKTYWENNSLNCNVCNKIMTIPGHTMCWSCRIDDSKKEIQDLRNMISGMVPDAEPQKTLFSTPTPVFNDSWNQILGAYATTNQPEERMEQTKMNLKNEFTDASIQVAINQISKAAVQGLKQLIEMAPRLKKADKKALINLLDTDVGRAVCLVFLGTILPQIPQFQNARAARLFTSIRTQGMALAGNDLIDTVAIPMLKKYTQKDELGLEHMALLNDPGAALAYLESQSKLGGAVAPLMKVLKQFNLVEKEAEVVENKNGMVTA